MIPQLQSALLAQVETALNIVDKASIQSDRWLFLSVLVVMGISASIAVRWLVASLRQKDVEHEAAMKLMREAHASERQEWRIEMNASKVEFLSALAAQRNDFRAELAAERQQFAQERILDREARHATNNAVQSVALALAEHRETLMAVQSDIREHTQNQRDQ